MIALAAKLYRTQWLNPRALLRALRAFGRQGQNLLGLVEFRARLHPHRIAITDDRLSLTYAELHRLVLDFSLLLHCVYRVQPGQSVAIAGRNGVEQILFLTAFSRLGVHVFFLNAAWSEKQLIEVIEKNAFDFLLADVSRAGSFDKRLTATTLLPFLGLSPNEIVHVLKCKCFEDFDFAQCEHKSKVSIPRVKGDFRERNPLKSITAEYELHELSQNRGVDNSLPKQRGGNIVLLTGGTGGNARLASRKTSMRSMLLPFLCLLQRLNLDRYQTVYIPLPFYHGYGLSALLMSLAMGVKVLLSNEFDAKRALQHIREEGVELMLVVPAMLRDLLEASAKSGGGLSPLKAVLSGGAPLRASLVQQFFRTQSAGLYNLYGTSETGVISLAGPRELRKYPQTVGRKIWGCKLRILDRHGRMLQAGETGWIRVKSPWAMQGVQGAYYPTGDLGYLDKTGLLFLKGRADDCIISGGENVYSADVEKVLLSLPTLYDACVIPVEDERFGQRFVAFVVPAKDVKPDVEALKADLRPLLARFQMPRQFIVMNALPRTETGKVDRKQLAAAL